MLKSGEHGITRDRQKAYQAVINVWIKASPENFNTCVQVIKQNKIRKAGMRDSFGGLKEFPKDIRIGLSIPPGLYYTLVKYERMHDDEFMKTKADLRWFARKFPQFCVIDRI